MKKILLIKSILISLLFVVNVLGAETYTGTALIYGIGMDTRVLTRTFTLRINGETSNDQAQEFLGILQQSGQDDLLKAMNTENLGNFSLGGNLARNLNVVRESTVDGKKRIFAVFERWLQFGEIRGGYRSVDYPFSIIEIYVDEKNGKGDGTFIPAARIRWNNDKKTGQNTVEIENFATYPAKLMDIKQR